MHRELKTNGGMLFQFRCRRRRRTENLWYRKKRFDTHKLQNPDISGIEYQQGTLFGYEVRQYLLEKYNRSRLDIPKTHCLDAACTGQLYTVMGWRQNVLLIKAMGRGSYQRTRVDKYGFPSGTLIDQKTVKGFATSVMVKAKVTSGKKKGIYIGRVAVRKSGSSNIQTNTETVQGISWKCCKIISHQKGYNFASQVSSPT